MLQKTLKKKESKKLFFDGCVSGQAHNFNQQYYTLEGL